MTQIYNFGVDLGMGMDIDKNNEQIDYIEKSTLYVCYASIIFLIILVLLSEQMSINKAWVSLLFIHENQMIDLLLFSFSIMTILPIVLIVINTVKRITYKIDQTIIRLNREIELKNKKIDELENKLNKHLYL
jgi:cell division protein FtsL